MREVIACGKTVEIATENACAELGKSRDEVSVEILEMPIKKLFKTIPARVKVTLLEEDNTDIFAQPTAPAAVAAPIPAKPSTAPAVASAPVAAPPKAQPVQGTPIHKEVVLEKEPEVPIDLAENTPAKKAVDYLQSILTAIGVTEVQITAFQQGDATLLRVDGEQVGDKLETRGETIQALSYLTDRAVNRGVDKKEANYLRVRLDIAGYRNRRERELITLAERTGQEVIKTGRSRTLAPMNPYERLIIHTRISEMEGLSSESTGSDTDRRVVIRSTAPGAKDGNDEFRGGRSGQGGGQGRGRPSGDRGRSNGGDRGRSGGGRGPSRGPSAGRGAPRGEKRESGDGYSERPPTNTPEREFANRQHDETSGPVVPQRRVAIEDADSTPLYGKIEL